MRARSTYTFLLILTVTVATMGQQSLTMQSPLVMPEDEQKLTAEEEEEARVLALSFKGRVHTTNDIGPLVDEMFVYDFSERLHQAPTNSIPMGFLDKTLIASASGSELRRYYIVSINFCQLYFRLYDAMKHAAKQTDDEEKELQESEVLSAEEINVLLSDPTLAKLAEEFKKDHEDETTKEEDSNRSAKNGDLPQAQSAAAESESAGPEKEDEVSIIKSAGQLNSISATLEKTTELMRKRLAGMPPNTLGDEDQENGEDSLSFDLKTLDEGEYGYPKNTHAIHVDVRPFCVDLIRTSGALKILSVSLYVD